MDTPAIVDDGSLTFGAAVELAVAMPLSWLPLISDYTFNAAKRRLPFSPKLIFTVSMALLRSLAKGRSLETSVQYAKNYISGALAAMLDLGKGSGPMNHAFAIEGEYTNE